MSRSRKDGRKSGAHRNGHAGREMWAARPGHYAMAAHDGRGTSARDAKKSTHRAERRIAAAECAEEN